VGFKNEKWLLCCVLPSRPNVSAIELFPLPLLPMIDIKPGFKIT
jgi:hypothetical protein